MEKDNLFYIGHIRECIDKILLYTAVMNEGGFLVNSLVQDVVIRNFEIIGEATKKLTASIKVQYPEIEWRKIAGMRDKLIHDYAGVDLSAVWAVITEVLPEFEMQIKRILTEENQ